MASQAVYNSIAEQFEQRLNRLGSEEQNIQALTSVNHSWEICCRGLMPLNIDEPDTRPAVSIITPHFQILYEKKLIVSLMEWFLSRVRMQQHLITKDIEKFMEEYEENRDLEVILKMFYRLLRWWETWGKPALLFNSFRLDGNLSFRRLCTIHLNSTLPPSFREAFRNLIRSTLDESSSEERNKQIFHVSGLLGLLQDYEHLLASVVKGYINDKVVATCAKDWSQPHWASMREWFTKTLHPWLRTAYTRHWMKPAEIMATVEPVSAKHQWHMCECMCRLRISELFDIIVSFPESTPALNDLKECMFQTGNRTELVQSLRASTKKRLLHPGADTEDIIKLYISTIRCLRILDPMGSLLFSVADPIRQYLRERPDTIRTIVSNLVEPSGEFVADEEEVKPLQDMQNLHDDYGDFNWMPEPADAEPEFRTTKSTDIISTLVSIYDSKDVFVKDLQVLLGRRLLEIKNFDYDKEIENLEILKLRFGEAPLQVCDVMMKDIMDSKRADNHIQVAQEGGEIPIHAAVVSRLFWPPLPTNPLVMPGQLRTYQQEYARRFSAFKPDRKIRFLSNLGTITLNLELSDRNLEVEATPLQAAIVELFSEQDTWQVDELRTKLGGVNRPSVDKALEFWMDHGILKSIGEQHYKLLEVAEERKRAPRPFRPRHSITDEQPAVSAAQQQEAEQMRVFWQFIQGILKNFSSVSLDKIHTMLKFAPNYDRTRDQLAVFMEALRREGVVEIRDGMWSLVPNGPAPFGPGT